MIGHVRIAGHPEAAETVDSGSHGTPPKNRGLPLGDLAEHRAGTLSTTAKLMTKYRVFPCSFDALPSLALLIRGFDLATR